MTGKVISFVAVRDKLSSGAIAAAAPPSIDQNIHQLTEALNLLVQELKNFCIGTSGVIAQETLSGKEQDALLACLMRVMTDILRVDAILGALLPHVTSVSGRHG